MVSTTPTAPESPPEPSLLRSVNGHWEAIDYPSLPDITHPHPVFGGIGGSDAGFVLASTTDGIWTSPDGTDWTMAYARPGFSSVAVGATTDVFQPDAQATTADGVNLADQ